MKKKPKKHVVDVVDQRILPLRFRWTLHADDPHDIHPWVKSVNLDMINHRIVVKLYAVVSNDKMPAEEWINSLTKPGIGFLTLKHYDGCGNPISIETFIGIKAESHSSDWDYAVTDENHVEHVVTMTYDDWVPVPVTKSD